MIELSNKVNLIIEAAIKDIKEEMKGRDNKRKIFHLIGREFLFKLREVEREFRSNHDNN